MLFGAIIGGLAGGPLGAIAGAILDYKLVSGPDPDYSNRSTKSETKIYHCTSCGEISVYCSLEGNCKKCGNKTNSYLYGTDENMSRIVRECHKINTENGL